jgi:hypothetical protein
MRNREIICTIEEYRKAFWAHRNLSLVEDKKYTPLVSHSNFTDGKSIIHEVRLFDTWINTERRGSFLLIRELVHNSTFRSLDLIMALEELLNASRLQFLDDKLFDRIRL